MSSIPKMSKMQAAPPKPKMLRQRDIARMEPKNNAAKKIQALWRGHKQREEYKQLLWEEMCERDRDNFGCMCGDWMCPGCGEGPFISCQMCGSDCRGGDYERWAFCSRRCMVRCGTD